MKFSSPIGMLALGGIIVIVYFLISSQPEKLPPIQNVKTDDTSTEKTALTQVAKSKPDLNITRSTKFSQATQLWQSIPQQRLPDTVPDNVHVEFIKVVNNIPMDFSEGQQVAFLIPQEDKIYSGKITESIRALGGVKISSGDLENGNSLASFSITEGENTTFVTVATGKSIYQVEIDKRSGVGIVIDDRELNQYRNNEDGILPPPEGVS